MSLIIPEGRGGSGLTRQVLPGDVLGGGESLKGAANSTTVGAVWSGAQIASGIINRTGPTGGYTDTTDTAANIITAIAGNSQAPNVLPGTTWRLRVINTVAQALTLAAGTGVVLGTGSTLNIAASLWREYLFTVLNASKVVTVTGSLVSASATVAFSFANTSDVALAIGPASPYNQISPGMSINSGSAGLQTATTIASVTQGQGGITGIVMSASATATAVVALTFGPTVQVDSIGSGTL